MQEPQPSTSGLNNKGGPIELSSEDSQLFSDVELTDDEDVCCVCNKWQPIELKDVEGVVFDDVFNSIYVQSINKLINCQNKFKFN
jgi:hypothetical protein